MTETNEQSTYEIFSTPHWWWRQMDNFAIIGVITYELSLFLDMEGVVWIGLALSDWSDRLSKSSE